jgi:hypothetical protein
MADLLMHVHVRKQKHQMSLNHWVLMHDHVRTNSNQHKRKFEIEEIEEVWLVFSIGAILMCLMLAILFRELN